MTHFLGPCFVSLVTKKNTLLSCLQQKPNMWQLLLVVLNHFGYDNNSRTFVLILGVFLYFVTKQVQLTLPKTHINTEGLSILTYVITL